MMSPEEQLAELRRGRGTVDFSGVVVKRGKFIRHLKLGDYVFGMINGWQGATYAEYVAHEAERMYYQHDREAIAAAPPDRLRHGTARRGGGGDLCPATHRCRRGDGGWWFGWCVVVG